MAKKAAPSRKRDEPLATGVGGAFGVVLAYAFLSRAFNTGSYWQYFTAIVFFVLGVKLLVRSFKNYYGNSKK